ncbi:hypothetical protein BDD12DRAFT_807121 [Trichophaea hybrida]|nr:hypothetical protein BDD12DRAFT_807121 [Trichophaea hybrida]
MSILLSTPALPHTRTVILSINRLHLKSYSLSTSVSRVSVDHSTTGDKHELIIHLVDLNKRVSAIEQEVEVSVEIDSQGRLLADVTPAGETFWGFDGRWSKKLFQGIDEAYSSSPQTSALNGGGEKKCYDAIVELFGPETPLIIKGRQDPKLEVVVGHGTMGAWGGMHAKMHTDDTCSVGEGSDFRLVVWILTPEGEVWG